MEQWLISANTEKWDISYYFEKDGFVYWKQKKVNYKIGDIVYIYCSKPIQKIMFKTCVEEESITFDENSEEKWVKLSFIEQVDKEELHLENLKLHGLKSALSSPIKLKRELNNYIVKFFKINKMWMVRAGEAGIKYNIFKENNFAAIGWNLGDLSGKSKDEIKSLCEMEYPNQSSNSIGSYVSMINAFVNDICVGDYILSSSDKEKREYVLGKCTSDYFYSDELDTDRTDVYKNCRKVEWLCIFRWDDLNNEIKPSKSVFEINCSIKKEIFELFYEPISFSSNKERNLIFFGAPGTGKSYNLNENKKELLKRCEQNYERVTFHPDYTYANFVGTYKPVPKIDEKGNETDDITYEYVPGPFMRTLIKALKNPEEPFLLVIEEINRANVAAVFGDIFQLLDRDNDLKSEYPINATEEMNRYLKKELNILKLENGIKCHLKHYWNKLLGENYTKITIPSNMFIWATMNSADQGVFPMDTAFKRRWNFKYFDINNGEDKLKNIKINLNAKEFTWNQIRREINEELISYGINEDKLMGPFFAFKDLDENLSKEDLKKEFKDIFKNKVIMYLFEDVARANRKKLFKGSYGNADYSTYFKICEDFEKDELKIFSKSIRDKLNIGE